MVATADEEEMNSLLSNFDQIHEDFKSGIAENQLLRSKLNVEINKTQALELDCKSLKQENVRLTKLYTESLSNLAEQLERRTKCSSLMTELERSRNEKLREEEEHRKALECLEQEYTMKVEDLEAQIRGLQLEKATNEATIYHLRQDFAAHKMHTQTLANRLEQVHFEVERKCTFEIQDLKDCLLVEQAEKNELNKKLRDLEKELLISKTKLVEQQQDLAANRLVETLKLKIMKLRKENEILKQKLSHSEQG